MSQLQITSRSPLPQAVPEGPMKANQPDPPIRELRNRWPFFSEGELKWLLSPKKQGAGHSEIFHEDMESDSHMAIAMESNMQGNLMSQNELLKADNGEEICEGPEPSESPVAFALDGTLEEPGVHDYKTVESSDFTFPNETLIVGDGYKYNDEIGHLGPRALVFHDEPIAGADVDQQQQESLRETHAMHHVDRDVKETRDAETSSDGAEVQEVHTGTVHPNPFHLNPFADGGLDPLAGEDMKEQAPIVFADISFTSGIVTEDYSTAPGNTSSTPLENDKDGDESAQEIFESEDDEDEAISNCVKRMSFDLSDGQQVPKFLADDVILALNCGGSSLEKAPFGFSFTEDKFFSGGDVLRTDERVTGVHDSGLYQTARYGNLSYVLRDLPHGNYVVDLHFAEIIFTNGPPGMRVFDVFVQGEKVISELDVYEEVGSNNALILSVSTLTLDGNLTVTFEGVIGSPTISAICIRSGPPTKNDQRNQVALSKRTHGDVSPGSRVATATPDSEPLDYQQELLRKDRERLQINEHKVRRQQMKNKARKGVREYEAKLEELRNECHEAWISLQDSNRINEMLRDDLCAKSLTCDSLATAVESQLSEINAIQERIKSEKQKWVKTINNGYKEIQVLKAEHRVLAQQTKEWVASFPDPTIMTTSVQSLLNEHQDLKRKYADECHERRQLYNKVLELKGNIRVFCRCRPLSGVELADNASSVAEFDSASNGDLVVRNGTAGKKLFKFDRVFSPQDGQSDVFADTAPVVVSVLDGFNVCIFAYGQTGTGKTFTMEGCVGNRGVNYRTLEELFNVAAQRKGEINYEISVSVMEVYNEQIRDLLSPPAALDQPSKKLEIKQLAEGGHHVPGLVEAQVTSMEEVWDVLQAGSSSRTVGSTRANDHSSRSHCMLCVMVKGENTITGECTKSKLWLVDLAGSERVAKSDAQGDRLKEAQSINKSLSALGDVIQALTTKSSHIPFSYSFGATLLYVSSLPDLAPEFPYAPISAPLRKLMNSKLTHLLQDSLGGDSKTLMFVQISPSEGDVSETLCSLNFASRVRGVELGPARKHLDSGELFKYKQLAERAKQESRSKEETAKRLEENLRGAEARLKAKEQMCQALSEKVKEIGELDSQLVNERRARHAAEASYREQKATMERMAAESKLSTEKLAEKAAVETKQAVREALDTASAAHAKEVSRLLQLLQQQANEIQMTPTGSTSENMMQTPVETIFLRPPLVDSGTASNTLQERKPALVESGSASYPLVERRLALNECGSATYPLVQRRPALVETGSSFNPPVERTPTLEYVVKPPDASEIMRNSCTGEVFGNENVNPQHVESVEAPVKTKGILKSSATKYISPNIPKRLPGKPRRTGFGLSVKPAVQVNSLVRRSQESASSNNSVANSLSDEEIRKLCGGGVDTSTLDASLQTLAQVLETTSTPTNWKGSSSRLQTQKQVHFRSPLLLPPREGARLEDLDMKDLDMENKPAGAVASKIARRSTLPTRPLGKVPAAGPHRVIAAGLKPTVPALREKRWN